MQRKKNVVFQNFYRIGININNTFFKHFIVNCANIIDIHIS